MARNVIGVNDPKTVKRYSNFLAVDVSQQAYFGQRFYGRGEQAKTPIQVLTELEKDAGDSVSYNLLSEMRMAPIEGEANLEGNEEQQRFSTDRVLIDQARCGINTGGSMTRKRTLHNLRELAKSQQANWWARFHDQLQFVYLSGARGINDNFMLPLGYTGRAGNAITVPTSNHYVLGGDATAFNNIDSADIMSVALIERLKTKADVQGGGATGTPVLQPIMIDGEEHFVLVMHSYQSQALRTNTSAGQWLDIQKAAAAAEGRKNPIFKGGLGMLNNVVLHQHRDVIRFNNAGAGANVTAARALFLGSQAGVVSFGSPGTNTRFAWNEETRDNGDKVVITSSSIFGCKKTTYTDEQGTAQDFGVFAVDTAITVA